jgi:hypothetical protein
MRRLALLPVALLACVVLAPGANAGQADINANGDVLTLDAAFHQALTSGKSFKRPATLELHTLFGNLYGNPTPAEGADLTFGLPKGTTINASKFPGCPIPLDDATAGDDSRCPSGSQIGSGTALVDARKSGLGSSNQGTVKIFNGLPHNGNPTVIFMAKVTVGATTIPAEIDLDVLKGPKLVEFDPQGRPRGAAAFDITSTDLKVGKTIKVKGKQVGYFAAPATCKNTWAFSLTLTRDSGTQTAKDTAPCVLG